MRGESSAREQRHSSNLSRLRTPNDGDKDSETSKQTIAISIRFCLESRN